MSGSGFLYHHLLFSMFFLTIFTAHGLEEDQRNSLMIPVSDNQSRMMSSWMSENHYYRRIRSFRVCGVCTCCGGVAGFCLLSPCCYHINCNIPNRPFGLCSFTPKSCNCFGCHL